MDLATLLALGALSIESLTADINNLPFTPTRIGDMKLFEEQGIDSTVALVGMNSDKLILVPNVPRGAPSQPKAITPKNAKAFMVPHLPQRSTVMADSLQGARSFGANGSSEPEAAATRITALNVVHRRDLDFTIEYHRLGAIKGTILDADGSTIYDLYTEFGVAQPTQAMVLGTDTTKVRTNVLAAKRKVETALGGVRPRGFHAFVGSSFMDKLVDHPNVIKAYERWQEGAKLRSDNRSGFEFGGVVFEEYEGSYDGSALIAADEGYLFPIGVPGMFITRFAPADYIETVNTRGLPYYSKTHPMDFNKGVMLESQSNPLNLNTRPAAVVHLTTN
jgi:hypothetical protein